VTIKEISKTLTLQHGESDCGVACLSSVVNFHKGSVTSLERLRQMSGTTKQGTTLLGLYEAARAIGFDAEGLKAKSTGDLADLNGTPAILYVVLEGGLQHYIVYYRQLDGQFVLGDPAKGIVQYSKEELEKIWDGKMLLKLVPTSEFVRSSILRERKTKWILDLLRQDFSILSASVFIGILITLLGLSSAIFSQRLIDEILPTSNYVKLSLGLTFLTLLLVARSGLSYLRAFFILLQGKDLNNRIINKFYGDILRLPKVFFDSKKTGELVARMNDTRRIQLSISTLAGNVVIDILLITISIVLTFFYSTLIGLMMVISLPIYFFFALVLNRRILKGQNEVMSSYVEDPVKLTTSIRRKLTSGSGAN
jgi:ATP-binding cassette subfamily B protein